jgi:hypothetical protein
MDEFLGVLPKFLGSDILVKEERNGRPSSKVKDDEKSIAKMEFKSALFRVKETKEELEQLHKISEEEVGFTVMTGLWHFLFLQVKRRGNMRRGESIESNVDMVDSPRGRQVSHMLSVSPMAKITLITPCYNKLTPQWKTSMSGHHQAAGSR